MSKTSTSIGWVLVDERDIAGDPLDHDAFDITDSSAAAPAATARRVREIAAASGYTVGSVHVTTSGNVASLRDALTESGFGDVVPVSLTAATRAWTLDAARANGHQKTAVCLLGRDSASLSLIDIASGTIQSATTTISRDGVSLVDWLNATFGSSDFRPEALYLIGSRIKLDTVACRLGEALSVPVLATHDAQLALARGAAFSDAAAVGHIVAARRSRFATHARTPTVIAAVAAVSLFALSSAGSPIPAATSASQRPPTTSPTQPTGNPTNAESAAPMALPPPPTAAPQPTTEEAPPALDVSAENAAANTVAPEAIPPTVPDAGNVAPPMVEHLPAAQPVQHIPEAQPAAAVGPAPTAEAPPSMPPPPPADPLADALSPLFGGLP